jgi:hypothetical protein
MMWQFKILFLLLPQLCLILHLRGKAMGHKETWIWLKRFLVGD